jgi:hypothetical protein
MTVSSLGQDDGLVDTALDEEPGRNNVDGFAYRVRDGFHPRSAERAEPQAFWNGIGHVNAGQVCGEGPATTATTTAISFFVGLGAVCWRRLGWSNQAVSLSVLWRRVMPTVFRNCLPRGVAEIASN